MARAERSFADAAAAFAQSGKAASPRMSVRDPARMRMPSTLPSMPEPRNSRTSVG